MLGLQPLPTEGGLFVQSYRSKDTVPTAALGGRYVDPIKPCGTAIYYLLTAAADSFSAMHRLPTDEVFHFYLGDPIETLLLFPDGTTRVETLGQEIMRGQHVQFAVPAGVWQGTALAPGGEYALIGTTMAPGFTLTDYEGGEREELVAAYPAAADRIRRLTRLGAEVRRMH